MAGVRPGGARCRPLSRRGDGQRAAVLALLMGVVLAAAACGGVASSSGSGSTTTDSTVTSTTSDPTSVAVLKAYRAAWTAFEQAAADANPDDPALATTMVAPQLTGVKGNLLADQQQGIVGTGTTTLHPKITELSATSATVVDCVYSTAELVYKVTGKPVPPVTPPENDGVVSTLALIGGTWKVSKQIVTDGKCAPGS